MTTETKTVAEQAAEIKAAFDTRFDELKAIATDALGKAEKGEPLAAGAKQSADEAITAVNEAKARLDEMEQKMALRGDEVSQQAKSLGEQFTDDASVKEFMSQGAKGRVRFETKAIISALTTVADGSAGDLIVPDRLAGVVQPALRKLTVRDLLAPGRTNSNAIQYVKETGFTNNAATVTETAGTAKAQSDIQFDIATSNVTTIAHWVLATRQILSDVPMLQSYIDGRLRYGLSYVEDNQLLNGAGTGTDLNGVYTQATASTANLAVVATPTKIDVLRAAMLQASLANLPPSGIVLHPTDWFTIEVTKDTAGGYIIGNPQDSTQPRMWGLPVVETPAMTVGAFLVGAFKTGAQIFDRQDSTVEISTEDSTNFRMNLVTILAEQRLALAVYNPLAFTKGVFATQITDLTS
jgi:HK97 family phage major capsid protein